MTKLIVAYRNFSNKPNTVGSKMEFAENYVFLIEIQVIENKLVREGLQILIRVAVIKNK
jgi:hypothetical protein